MTGSVAAQRLKTSGGSRSKLLQQQLSAAQSDRTGGANGTTSLPISKLQDEQQLTQKPQGNEDDIASTVKVGRDANKAKISS